MAVLRAYFHNFHTLCFSKPEWPAMLAAVEVVNLASSVESRYRRRRVPEVENIPYSQSTV